jgi:hypothetical protein
MNFLGHQNVKNTLQYVQLEETLFKGDDEYIYKAAGNAKNALKKVYVHNAG